MSKKQNHSSHPSPNSHSENHTKSKLRVASHVKQRRVRYDRIAAVVIPMLLLVAMIVFICLYSCDQSDNNNNNTLIATPVTSTSSSTEKQPVETTTPAVATESTSLEDEKKITLTANGVKSGNLIVINNDHAYAFPNNDLNLTSVYEARNSSYSVSDMDVLLDSETITYLNQMMAAFEEETGYSGMQVFSGYRTKEDQDERYDGGSSDFRGGYTDYHSGRTFNLKINFGDGTSDYYNAEKYPNYSWIAEHAAEYGFIVRYPNGKDNLTGEEGRTYTFRYVGIPHAIYITEHKICLEEYVSLIRDHTSDEPLEITINDTTYSVFYVTVGGTNDVKATVHGDYTTSGDNIGGYIVTCQ